MTTRTKPSIGQFTCYRVKRADRDAVPAPTPERAYGNAVDEVIHNMRDVQAADAADFAAGRRTTPKAWTPAMEAAHVERETSRFGTARARTFRSEVAAFNSWCGNRRERVRVLFLVWRESFPTPAGTDPLAAWVDAAECEHAEYRRWCREWEAQIRDACTIRGLKWPPHDQWVPSI